MVNLKKKYNRMMTFEPKKFEKIVISHCNFLWTNYTNIFNRIMKDELNLNILRKFIDTLREVEQLYIDSALQREKKLNVEDKKRAPKHKKPVNNISWAKFKASGLNEST